MNIIVETLFGVTLATIGITIIAYTLGGSITAGVVLTLIGLLYIWLGDRHG